jgi:hypothetical protein
VRRKRDATCGVVTVAIGSLQGWSNVNNSCRRCENGELREEAIVANYKSFVVSLMRCNACGATFERKENAHRPSEPLRMGRVGDRKDRPRPGRYTPEHLIPDPARAPAAPAPPARRGKLAKRLERPFNIRITRWKDRPGRRSEPT